MLSSYSFRRKLLCKVCFVIVAYKHNKYPLHLIVPLKKMQLTTQLFTCSLGNPLRGKQALPIFKLQ